MFNPPGIRHLLKPLWKRKGRNLLLSLEIALAFTVVFAIAAAGLRFWELYRQPVGFEWRDVWSVQLLLPDAGSGGLGFDPALYDRFEQALEAMPEVGQVAFAAYSPYERSEWNTTFVVPGSERRIDSHILQVDDDFVATMGVEVVEGRAFSAADEGAAMAPVLINRRFAQAAYPGRSAVGQVLALDEPGATPGSVVRTTSRVVGVFDTFRNQGEYMAPGNFLLSRYSPGGGKAQMRTLLLRVEPGTPRRFEVELSRRLKLVRNDWSYAINPMADMREAQLRSATIPLVLLSVVAAFLLVMVAFGLFGVLWQNTTRRVPEFGLRRAAGATAADITRQVVLEQVLLCLLPIAAALLLLVQVPITGALGEALSWPLFAGASVVAVAVMVLVSVACAAYPAWRASRLSPIDALHHE
jgi:putative ABC transport system permease protein